MRLALNSFRQNLNFCANRKILIVDDNEDDLYFTKRAVKKSETAGDTFEITTASTVEDAKKSIIDRKPDMLITDGHIKQPNDPENPDGLDLADFAAEQGVKSIGLVSGWEDTISKAKDKKYEAIDKSDINYKSNIFIEFFGKLMEKLAN